MFFDLFIFWRKPFDRRTAKSRRRASLTVKRTRIKAPGLPSESANDPMTPFQWCVAMIVGSWTTAALLTAWGVL